VHFKVYAPNKLEPRWTGSCEISSVDVNGNLTIRLNAHTVERVLNIVRRLKPYRSCLILMRLSPFSVVGESCFLLYDLHVFKGISCLLLKFKQLYL
jgi:hypothetical protein